MGQNKKNKKYGVKKVDTGANHDIMSVSEREQAMLVHRERRMAIMIAVYAASSTKGANHEIIGNK